MQKQVLRLAETTYRLDTIYVSFTIMLKVSIYIGLIIILILGVSACAYLPILVGAYKEDCKLVNEWKIDKTTISVYRCLGWAGPHYNKYFLKDDINHKTLRGYRTDSCIISFEYKNTEPIQFDIFTKKILEN